MHRRLRVCNDSTDRLGATKTGCEIVDPELMGSKRVPFAGVQLHRAVGFKQVKLKRIVDFDEGDTAIPKEHLCLVERQPESRVLHRVCSLHFMACFLGCHLVRKTRIVVGLTCNVLAKPLNHRSRNPHVECFPFPQQHITPRKIPSPLQP